MIKSSLAVAGHVTFSSQSQTFFNQRKFRLNGTLEKAKHKDLKEATRIDKCPTIDVNLFADWQHLAAAKEVQRHANGHLSILIRKNWTRSRVSFCIFNSICVKSTAAAGGTRTCVFSQPTTTKFSRKITRNWQPLASNPLPRFNMHSSVVDSGK